MSAIPSRPRIIVICTVFITAWLTPACFAQALGIVEVTLETEWHVGPPHTNPQAIFRPLKLTYTFPTTPWAKPLTVYMSQIAVSQGAGLLVNYIGPNGETAAQSLPIPPGTLSFQDAILIQASVAPTYMSVWVFPGANLDFSRLGTYYISYIHPWPAPSESLFPVLFQSNTLIITCVTAARFNQLQQMLRDEPELELASYKFKNPPSSIQYPKQRRAEYLAKLRPGISDGTTNDEVLFLLGSPDIVQFNPLGIEPNPARDERWSYQVSSTDFYEVSLRNGIVVTNLQPPGTPPSPEQKPPTTTPRARPGRKTRQRPAADQQQPTP